MVSPFQPARVLFWFACIICSIQVMAFKIETEPYKTDRPAPGDTLFYNIIIEPGDPRLVDFILYNGDLDNSTVIFNDMKLVGNEDASGYDIPFVPPGKKYTGRLGRPNTRGREVLIESAPFEIWPQGTLASTDTAVRPSGSPATTPTPSVPVQSVATLTKLLTLAPSSTPPVQAPTGGASKMLSGTGVLAVGVAFSLFCVWI